MTNTAADPSPLPYPFTVANAEPRRRGPLVPNRGDIRVEGPYPGYIRAMGAGHSHGSADTRASRMVMAAGILGVFFAIELSTALLIGSLALLADATHAHRPGGAVHGSDRGAAGRRGSASAARTYGWHRAEVFTAVANAVLLLGVAVFIVYEAIERLGEPPDPGWLMIVVALLAWPPISPWYSASVALESSLAVKGAYMEVDGRRSVRWAC